MQIAPVTINTNMVWKISMVMLKPLSIHRPFERDCWPDQLCLYSARRIQPVTGAMDKSCEGDMQGENRYERGLLYKRHLRTFC